jgi:hypothetical protein
MRSARRIFFILFFIPVIAGAQDTLFLLNGNTINGKIREINPDTMFLLIQVSKKNKTKFRNINLGDLYAFSFKDSARMIIYARDTNRGIDFTPEQMGSYIRGIQFAKTKYKTPWVMAGGAAVGFAGPYMFPFILGILAPTAYCGIIGITPVHYKKQQARYPELFSDPYFVEGYKDRAKKKKVINTIISSAIGIVVSAATTTILFYSNQ